MTLTQLGVDELGIINSFRVMSDMSGLNKLMVMGIVPGLEIRKLSEVATCAEYRVEGNSARIVISKELSDYILVDTLDETLE